MILPTMILPSACCIRGIHSAFGKIMWGKMMGARSSETTDNENENETMSLAS